MSTGFFLQVSLDPDSELLLEKLVRDWEPEVLLRKIAEFLKTEGPKIVSLIRRQSFKGRRGSSDLSRSIRSYALMVQGSPAVRVGVFEGEALKYAGIRELGTKKYNPESPYPTIVPKRGKFSALSIPTEQGGALDASGRQKVSGPSQQPDLKYVRIRNRSDNVVGLIVRSRRTREALSLGSLNVVWILVSRLDIPPKFYLRKGMEEYLPILITRLADFIQRGLS